MEIYQRPRDMVEDISALGLRHVGYGILTEHFSPFVEAEKQLHGVDIPHRSKLKPWELQSVRVRFRWTSWTHKERKRSSTHSLCRGRAGSCINRKIYKASICFHFSRGGFSLVSHWILGSDLRLGARRSMPGVLSTSVQPCPIFRL